MPRRAHLLFACTAATVIGLAAPAVAQGTDETEERGLTSPEVQESQPPNPTDQGNRSPETMEREDDPRLYDLLAQVRRAPPTLDGADTTPRPNDFASEPAKEMAPEQAEDLYLFPEDYVE